MFRTTLCAATIAASICVSVPAFAHASFEVQEVVPGQSFKSDLSVPHGSGSGGNHSVRIAMDMEDAGAGATVGDLAVSRAFTRATLPNAPVGGGYLTIVNSGDTADRLVAASSPVAGEVQIHQMSVVDDVMEMRQLEDGIEIPAGGEVALAPGGMHLMFMQLNQPFEEGTQVPVTLTFENAGEIEVMLSVGGFGATTDPHAGHGDMNDHGSQ